MLQTTPKASCILVLVSGLAACNTVMPGSAPAPAQAVALPSALQPAANERPAFTVHARGVQIYACAAAEGAAPAWSFVAPEATLFQSASSDTVMGSHGAGPFWQAADGSKVVGKVKARADAPSAAAIPWLLLTTTSTGGPGRMAGATSVQRIHTAGGVAPAGGCASKDDVGKQARVPYTSDYVFFTAGG
jgi:Protein of unknown function (DUF3455)